MHIPVYCYLNTVHLYFQIYRLKKERDTICPWCNYYESEHPRQQYQFTSYNFVIWCNNYTGHCNCWINYNIIFWKYQWYINTLYFLCLLNKFWSVVNETNKRPGGRFFLHIMPCCVSTGPGSYAVKEHHKKQQHQSPETHKSHNTIIMLLVIW